MLSLLSDYGVKKSASLANVPTTAVELAKQAIGNGANQLAVENNGANAAAGWLLRRSRLTATGAPHGRIASQVSKANASGKTTQYRHTPPVCRVCVAGCACRPPALNSRPFWVGAVYN